MEDTDPGPLGQLTAEMAWMRRLARALLRDGDADDLAQDAWIVASEHAPAEGASRPWLGRVMLNLARMRARSQKRRVGREEKTADLVQPEVRPDDLVERVELQQLVASEVLALEEPYRSTVLLRYFEELSCAEIARRLEVPEGTVRRRLKVALDHLRGRIGAKRRSGLLALAPLAGVPSNPIPVAVGVIAMKKLVAAVVVLILLVVAGVWWRTRESSTSGTQSAANTRHTTTAATAGASVGAAANAKVRDASPAWLAQAGVPARRIAGRVTFAGAPVAGASVELANLASESGLVEAPHTTTNAAGEFDFGAQRAMPWSVQASAPGKASARLEIDLRDPRADGEHVEIALGACTAAMTGVVRDASGGPIASARIATVAPELVARGPGVKTDDKGAYELCVETRWPGWVSVEVSAASYASIAYSTVVPGRIEVNFALVPEATVVGRVIRDDNGAPVPNAYVFVPTGRGLESSPLRGTFTDTSGRFRLDRMTAGRHLVFARGEGMARSVEGTPVVVGVGQTSVEIEIRLEAGSTLRGRVVEGKKPIGGAHVVVLGGVESGPAAFSQDDGSFELAGVAYGEIAFGALPFDVVSPTKFQVIRPMHENIEIAVEPLGTIIGHVIRGKQPVPGATIHIQGPNDRDLKPIAADARGRFEARGLQPGPWTLFASDDRVGAFGKAPEVVQLARAQTAEVTIELLYAGAIEGRVVDQNGSPVPGVTVFFRSTNSDDAGTAATASDGSFRAATLTGGTRYRPMVRRNLLASTELRPVVGGEFPLVDVRDGADTVKGVVLAVQLDHLTIAGKVVDADGVPVSDARVVAQLVETGRPRFDLGFQDPSDTTTVDGQFSIGDLLAGSYSLRARSAEGVEAVIADVRAGRTDITFVLPAAGGIDVTTVGFKTAPQVSAIKSGTSGQSAPIPATAGANGFTLRGLSPGTYFVTARTPTEAASTSVTVVTGRTVRATLTSGGSSSIAGRVIDFKTKAPVQGMTCRAQPRAGTEATPFPAGDGARTDAQGAFIIAAAPAGPIAILCDGLWRTYSEGLRLVTAQPAQRIDVDVPVVRWSDDVIALRSNLGAELDPGVLVPRLVHVAPNGPAATARFADGDVIVSVDGASVTELSPDGVFGLLVYRAPGTKVRVSAMRGATTVSGEITLGEAR